jgi:uncharacterized membrane protein YkoI
MQTHSIILLSGLIFPGLAAAQTLNNMPPTGVPMERCLAAVLNVAGGTVSHMKLEIEGGQPYYEFKVKGDDGHEWEAECDANSGEVVEMQREVSRQDSTFNQAARVVENEARHTAAERYPGKIVKSGRLLNYEGRPIYEVEITTADGREMEVEVDGATGEILNVEDESAERTVYEIGED